MSLEKLAYGGHLFTSNPTNLIRLNERIEVGLLAKCESSGARVALGSLKVTLTGVSAVILLAR
jgi:hypothetical protein